MAPENTQATTEELLDVVFSVWSIPRLYNEGQLPLEESLLTTVRRVEGWCEMAASLVVSEWSSELVGESVSELEGCGSLLASCC
jgi:hypothetical protein